MKKLSIATLVFLSVSNLYAWELPWKKLGVELNAVKVDVAKNAESVVKADVVIGQNMKALADLQLRVGNIEAKAAVQGNAVAALKSDITQTQTDMKAGGNIVHNDGDMIVKIFNKVLDNWYLVAGAFFTFIGSFFGGLWAMLKFQAFHYERLLKAKDLHIANLTTSNAAKDEKNDTWFRKYLESVTGHKTNGNGEVK